MNSPLESTISMDTAREKTAALAQERHRVYHRLQEQDAALSHESLRQAKLHDREQLNSFLQNHQENTLPDENDKASTEVLEKTTRHGTLSQCRDMCRATMGCLH